MRKRRVSVSAVVDKYATPVNSRPVRNKAVSCPTCQVPIGAACIGSTYHIARRRMALRAERITA